MESMAYIGAGMCALSMMAAAWGVSQVWTTIISTVGRNPQVKKDVDIYGWAGFAAVEISCGHIHSVSEAVDDFLYFFSRGVGHAPGMVDYVGCGFERNACLFGHVS